MKNIVHAVFCLIMPLIGKFTRDIELCFEEAIKHYPSMAINLYRAKDWTVCPSENVQQVLDFLNTFGIQLLSEVDRWMKYHNSTYKKELLWIRCLIKSRITINLKTINCHE